MCKAERFTVWKILSLLSVAVVLSVCLFLDSEYKAILMYAAVLLSFVPFFLAYERRQKPAAELMPVVALAAAAAVGRILFAAVPNFKPTTAVVIIAGIALGSSNGYICGALAALASNIFFGQGAWTPWQMFAWGLIGYLSGALNAAGGLKNRTAVCIWGFFSSVLYGVILDCWSVIGFVSPLTPGAVLAAYAAGIPFTMIHAVSTVIFLFLLYRQWLRILCRIRLKYLSA